MAELPAHWRNVHGLIQREAYERHDETCKSLPHFWFGHTGGVSCPSDLFPCTECRTYFYNEGLAWWDYDADEDIELCECCARGKSHG